MVSLKRFYNVVVAPYVLTACTVAVAWAADGDKKSAQLPHSGLHTGLLAVSSVSGASTSITGDVIGGEDIFGETKPPLSGSIARRGEYWRFSVSNNSEERYTVNVDVIQKNDTLSRVAYASYSYTLKPGQSDGQEVRAALGAMRAELHLRSYRNLTPTAQPTE
jgi:hypothetical protein